MLVARDERARATLHRILVYQYLPDFHTCDLDSNRNWRTEADTNLDHDPVGAPFCAKVDEGPAEADPLELQRGRWRRDGKRKGAAVPRRTPSRWNLVTRDSRLATQSTASNCE